MAKAQRKSSTSQAMPTDLASWRHVPRGLYGAYRQLLEEAYEKQGRSLFEHYRADPIQAFAELKRQLVERYLAPHPQSAY